MIAACFVGDNDVCSWYVVVELGAGQLLHNARCCVPCFECGVVEHQNVHSPGIVGREVEVL